MLAFGEIQGYTGKPCESCGRYRVLLHANGYEVCEKCSYCKQLKRFVPDSEYYDDTEEEKAYAESWAILGKPIKNKGENE